MGLNPLLEVLAIDAALPTSLATCQIELTTDNDAAQKAGLTDAIDCAQHHACMSYCQFAPLQPAGPQKMRARPFFWLSILDKADNFNTRFLESIERPPRV